MIKVIKQKLSALYQNAQEEFHKTPIQFSAALVVIIGVLLQILITLWLSGSSSGRIAKLLSKNTEISIPLITTSIVLLLLALYRILQLRVTAKHFEFFPYNGVTWKVFHKGNNQAIVDFPSYCLAHQVQHIEGRNTYLCPICGDKALPTHDYFPSYALTLHAAVESIVKARQNKHLKIK